MTKEVYIERNFSPGSLAIIDQANTIIREYTRAGFDLTLRQLYYQFVSRDLIRNKQSEYKRLGSVINDARLAGLISWSAIIDRTRHVRTHSSWDSPSEIIESAAAGFQIDLWENQEAYVEVWIEKDALVGVIERPCDAHRVPFFACRGYSSQSAQWAAGKRFLRKIAAGKRCIVLHLGDHDPSGMDMTRDNRERVSLFAQEEVEFRRLALNFGQVEAYNPPPNPAKETDSRSGPYIAEYGESSWELDALDPPVIAALITDQLAEIVDADQWAKDQAREEEFKEALTKAAENWSQVAEFVRDL